MAKRGRPRKQQTKADREKRMLIRYGWDISQPANGVNTANAKTLIVNINRTIRQFYDTFGGESKEYKDIEKMVRDLVDTSLDVMSPPTATSHPAIRLSQSKNALAHWSNNAQELQELRNAQLNYGSVGTYSSNYRHTIKQLNKQTGSKFEYSRKGIKELAEKFEFLANNQEVMYKHIKQYGNSQEVSEASDIMHNWNTQYYGDTINRFKLDMRLEEIYNQVIARGNPFNNQSTNTGRGFSPPITF